MTRITWLILLVIISIPCYSLQPPNQGYVHTTYGDVWYKIVGNRTKKPPIIVIHGGPGGGSCGLDIIEQLGTDRQIIFYDQHGSGKSPLIKNNDALWQVNVYVDELDQVIKALQIKNPIIFSHSWGAAIAAQYLINNKHNVSGVIFASPYVSTPLWIKDANYLLNQMAPRDRADLNLYFKKHLQLHPSKPPYDQQMCDDSMWNDRIYQTMWGPSEFRVDGNLKAFDLYPMLSKITIPTLILIGDSDEVTVRTATLYQHKIKRSRLIVIKRAAHMSMSDQPKVFVKVVKRFTNNCCN